MAVKVETIQWGSGLGNGKRARREKVGRLEGWDPE